MKNYHLKLTNRFKKEFRNLDNYIQVLIVSFLYKFISIFSFQKIEVFPSSSSNGKTSIIILSSLRYLPIYSVQQLLFGQSCQQFVL